MSAKYFCSKIHVLLNTIYTWTCLIDGMLQRYSIDFVTLPLASRYRPVTTYSTSLPNVTDRSWPLLSVTDRYWPLLSVTLPFLAFLSAFNNKKVKKKIKFNLAWYWIPLSLCHSERPIFFCISFTILYSSLLLAAPVTAAATVMALPEMTCLIPGIAPCKVFAIHWAE